MGNTRKRSLKQRIGTRGTSTRWYGDFRDYADVGGGIEALKPAGGKRATRDERVALKLASERVQALQRKRLNKDLLGVEKLAHLGEYAARHLRLKAAAGKVREETIFSHEQRLRAAIAFLGDRPLRSVGVEDVQRWVEALSRQPCSVPRRCLSCREVLEVEGLEARCASCGAIRRIRTLSGQSVRHYLNSLSNLYRRAQSEGYVQPGYNPVGALMEKPTGRRVEARWLEVPDAALYLESARSYEPTKDDAAIPFIYPIIATLLLTGGRKREVLGLEVGDLSFDRQTVTFRPHGHRRLKTLTSFRTVPLHPQLEEILRAYLRDHPRIGGLLFPSPRTRGMITDLRKALDAIGERAGWKSGEIRTKMFRHTYCAARLQTLDQGHPVSVYTVARELGHGGDALVKRVYGHLGNVRHRAEHVEYRIEQHAERAEIRERLALLSA
jgi:integrase